LNERDQAWFLLGTRRSDAAQYLGSSMAMANSGGSSSRHCLNLSFCASLFLYASYMLVERELHHVDWPFAPEKPRTSYQAASASLAFLVVADEGMPASIYLHLTLGRGS
jgi:hypothetical protein